MGSTREPPALKVWKAGCSFMGGLFLAEYRRLFRRIPLRDWFYSFKITTLLHLALPTRFY